MSKNLQNQSKNIFHVFLLFSFILILLLFLYFFRNLDKNTVFSSAEFLETLSKIEQNSKQSTNSVQNSNKIDFKNLGEPQLVSKVIDGDTILLQNGQKVRYIGIDTPELVASKKPKGCYAQQAYEKNKELVEGKYVYLVKDVSQTDQYQRLLRYVFVDAIFVNDYLVLNGYAKVSTFPPDVKYAQKFVQSEDHAFTQKLGLWGSACGK